MMFEEAELYLLCSTTAKLNSQGQTAFLSPVGQWKYVF